MEVGGLQWQPKETLQKIGIGSLQSRILCENHNRQLSSLDAVGGKLYGALVAVDKAPAKLADTTKVGGPLIERWLLKVVAGLVASKRERVPEQWKGILLGAPWPTSWGMYVSTPDGSHVHAGDFYFETRVHPGTTEVLAVDFSIAGPRFTLLLGTPDHPHAWGIARPRGFIFRTPIGERRIEFGWPFETNECLIFEKVGQGGVPAHRARWKAAGDAA